MTKILLADDSVTIQKVVELTFSDEESQVVAVSDGASAYEKARMDRPDIILSDVVMPGMDGYELCYRIKTDPSLKNIPFLFLKGTFESFDEEKAKKSGADGFIVKPFEAQELVNKVKELIARSASFEAPSPLQEVTPVQPEAAPAPAPQEETPATPPPPAAAPSPPPPPRAEMPPVPPPPAETVPPPPVQAEIPPDAPQRTAAEPPASERPPAEQAPPPATPAAEADIFGDEQASLGGEEEDLWSEVSLRDSKAPLADDRILEEESFWGASEGEQLSSGQPSGAAETTPPESLIEEVEEAEIMDLTEEAPAPPSAEAVEQPDELFEAFEEPGAVAETVPPPPSVEPAPPSTQAAVQPPESGTATAALEKVVGTRIEDAIRAHLGPAISEAAAKIVEQVAWEVIPDLAEAMIKSEIERIKKEAGGKERG